MRKWILLCLPLLLTACAAVPAQVEAPEIIETPVEEETTQETDFDDDAVAEQFNRLTSSDPTEQEVLDFFDHQLEKVSAGKADEMVLEFERVQKNLYRKRLQFMIQKDVQEILLNAFSHGSIPEDLEDIEDDGLRKYIQDLRDSGYVLEIRDGRYIPVIHYGFYKRFEPYLSKEVQQYFSLMEVSKETLYSVSQTLPITWDQAFERILAFENYLKIYPDTSRYDTLQSNYEYYVKLYLYGTQGTPAFPYQTRSMDQWLKTSYGNVFLGNDSSAFVLEFKDYIRLLEEEAWLLTEPVEAKRNEVIKNLNLKFVY